MKRELRKTEDRLVIDGIGVIIFAVWSVMKTFLLYWMGEARTETAEMAEDIPLWIVVLFLMFFSALLMTPRLFIGFSAIAEGKGKRKRNAYLVLTGLIIARNFFLYAAVTVYVIRNPGIYQPRADNIVALVIDFTSLWILIEMIVMARRVRRLRNWAKE